jgi:hypothetical protein
MFDDIGSRHPLIGMSGPFPVPGRPGIAIARPAWVFGAQRGRGNVGDDLGGGGRSGFEEEESVSQANSY